MLQLVVQVVDLFDDGVEFCVRHFLLIQPLQLFQIGLLVHPRLQFFRVEEA